MLCKIKQTLLKGGKMIATKVQLLPANPERDKEVSLFFQNGRISFKAERITYASGILFLDGYDYKAKFNQQIELLAGCFEEDSNIEKELKEANILSPWETLQGIVMAIGPIPVLVSKYNHDPEVLGKELERQMRLDSQNRR